MRNAIKIYGVLTIVLFVLCQSYAYALDFTVHQVGGATSSSTPLVSVKSLSTANQGTAPEDWTAEFTHPMVLIPMDDLVIPIELEKPTLILKSNTYGRIKISRDQITAVTRTKTVSYQYPAGTTLNYRPTLFISLCGFRDNLSPRGNGICQWQMDMEYQLRSTLTDYQYKDFAVDWATHLSIAPQAHDLAGVVMDFLNTKSVPWDVVIIGHSRGGIFAHDLAKLLVGSANIKNLHIFLLDPVAVTMLNDSYPSSKPQKSPTTTYASLYYNGSTAVEQNIIGQSLLDLSVITLSDMDIPGYDNYGRYAESHLLDYPHMEFAEDWLNDMTNGFQQALADIKAHKDAGSFAVEGDSGMEVVKISNPNDITFNGDVTVSDGNVNVTGSFSVADLPATAMSLDATVGKDGVDLSIVNGVSVAHTIINSQVIAVQADTPVASLVAEIDNGTLSANVSTLVLNSGVQINSEDISLHVSIGSLDLVNASANSQNVATDLLSGFGGVTTVFSNIF